MLLHTFVKLRMVIDPLSGRTFYRDALEAYREALSHPEVAAPYREVTPEEVARWIGPRHLEWLATGVLPPGKDWRGCWEDRLCEGRFSSALGELPPDAPSEIHARTDELAELFGDLGLNWEGRFADVVHLAIRGLIGDLG